MILTHEKAGRGKVEQKAGVRQGHGNRRKKVKEDGSILNKKKEDCGISASCPKISPQEVGGRDGQLSW